ncbi:hypothetical protein I79_005469 [Cricetulus griseus]|uniref:Uncharacterized protein n=1 Tax=Cricetulus griseus TaxID=10029 RepID=G3H591_CRIGR|nr:hypothetical protein I79_005469 [Cricetulus griseus]
MILLYFPRGSFSWRLFSRRLHWKLVSFYSLSNPYGFSSPAQQGGVPRLAQQAPEHTPSGKFLPYF